MKKFIYILPCLAFSLILLFNYRFEVSAQELYTGILRVDSSLSTDGEPWDYKASITTNDRFMIYYNESPYFSSGESVSIGVIFSQNSSVSLYSPNGSIYASFSPSHLPDSYFKIGTFDGLDYYYYSNGLLRSYVTNILAPSSSRFLHFSTSGNSEKQYIVNTLFPELIGDNYINPDLIGGSPENPKPNSSIGFLTNVQDKSGWNNKVYNTVTLGNSVTLPYDTEFTFGWDSTTSTGANLSNYKVKIQYAFTYLKSNTETAVLNYVEYVDFNNNYSFKRKWSELLNANGYSVPTSQPSDNYNGALASSYPWSYCKVFVQPILTDSQGFYNIGGYTSIILDKNAGDGFIMTENQDFSSDGFKPSADQSGTGVNSNPITNTNTSTGVTSGAGEIPNVDFSNLKETLNDLTQMVSGVPLIIATMFSFLPNWLILLIVSSIGLMVAVGLFKALINIIS